LRFLCKNFKQAIKSICSRRFDKVLRGNVYTAQDIENKIRVLKKILFDRGMLFVLTKANPLIDLNIIAMRMQSCYR